MDTGQLGQIIDSLERIRSGDWSHRLEVRSDSSLIKELQARINDLLVTLVSRAHESMQYSMDLSMALSECFQVLREVRGGNLGARASDLLVSSDEELVATLGKTLNETIAEIQSQMDTITQQRTVIRELSTPILEVWDKVLILPVIGLIDSRRTRDIMERLLQEIVQRQALWVIIDITGVEVVDTSTADEIIKLIASAGLLGARCILTGIRPAVAKTLTDIGVDLSFITTSHSLRAGLTHSLREIHRSEKE